MAAPGESPLETTTMGGGMSTNDILMQILNILRSDHTWVKDYGSGIEPLQITVVNPSTTLCFPVNKSTLSNWKGVMIINNTSDTIRVELDKDADSSSMFTINTKKGHYIPSKVIHYISVYFGASCVAGETVNGYGVR